jgi:hypothetical protein
MVGSAEGVGHEGEDGVIGARTINDAIAIIFYELAKICQKRLLACALLDRALEGHLCLHTEVSSKLDECRRAIIQLEWHREMYRGYFEILSDRIPSIVKNALDAQRSGALSIAEYVSSSNVADGPDYRVGRHVDPSIQAIDTSPGSAGANEAGLTEEERDQGWEFVDGVKLMPNIGMDLLRAVCTHIGPHVVETSPQTEKDTPLQAYAKRVLSEDKAADEDSKNPSRRERTQRDPNTKEVLPLGWYKHKTSEGTYYYRNLHTGTSHWRLPQSFRQLQAKKDVQHAAELPLVQEIFGLFDADKDDKLSLDEYTRFIKAIGAWGSWWYTDEIWEEAWPRECRMLLCEEAGGITRESFAILYGDHRLGKAQTDLENCRRSHNARVPAVVACEVEDQALLDPMPELEPEPEHASS